MRSSANPPPEQNNMKALLKNPQKCYNLLDNLGVKWLI